jgi:hypothetical protein
MGLPETNTLAYYENPYITAVKCFIVQAQGANLINYFGVNFTATFSKLDHFINKQF